MQSRRRAYIFVPLFIGLCAFTANFLSAQSPFASKAKANDDAAKESVKSFTSVYTAIEQNFADPVDPDKAIYGSAGEGAIPGMLHTLDPHSNFFDPKEYSKLREDQSGRYYGIGMMVGPRNFPEDGKTV